MFTVSIFILLYYFENHGKLTKTKKWFDHYNYMNYNSKNQCINLKIGFGGFS